MEKFSISMPTIIAIVLAYVCTSAEGHHDEDRSHGGRSLRELHGHQIFRLKGLLYSLFGTTVVIILGVLLYQYLLRWVRQRRNQHVVYGGFSERGTLLPIAEFETEDPDPPSNRNFHPMARTIVRPLVQLKDNLWHYWNTYANNNRIPIPGATVYRPTAPIFPAPPHPTPTAAFKFGRDPWEGIL